MALVLADRVKETSTTAGTGALTLNGASAGYQSFAVVGNGNTTYYTIVDTTANTWEVGIGTYSTTGPSLSRDTVLANSSGTTSLISFASNPKDVFVTYPAGRSVYSGASTNLALPAPGTSGNLLTSDGSQWTSAAAPPAIPSGTVMLFVQTAAPTGWTKSTTHDNKALRVVSGTASSGGTVAFTTAFASRAVSGSVSTSLSGSGSISAYTLTTTDIPSHTHAAGLTTTVGSAGKTGGPSVRGITNAGNLTSATGGGGAHSHGFTNPSYSSSFTGTAIDLTVQYVDVIIATKN